MLQREEIISALVKGGIPSPRLETDIILKSAAPNYPAMNAKEEQRTREYLARRLAHEPLDKIIGKKEFYKSVFKVSDKVLSPRPDTEILVEKALELLSEDKPAEILDLGTGSGCILLSLLKERKFATGVGVDVSKEALAVAQENAESLGVKARVTFINKSWLEDDFINGTFDMVVSNPPYIPSTEIEALDEEVKTYDPRTALDGGSDGLKCYRDIAEVMYPLLKEGGYLLLEVGYNQARDVAGIFTQKHLKLIEIAKDLSDIERCVILKKSVAK